MKKFNTFIIAFTFAALTTATVSFATFEGGRNSLSIDAVIAALAGTYAELGVANIFQQDQQIEKLDIATPAERRGLNIQSNEAGSLCITDADGSTKDFCITSKFGAFYVEGSTSAMYGQAGAADIGLIFDSIGARTWISPLGSATVAAGTTSPPDTSFHVGGNTRTNSTFLVDATNDWTKHLPIAAPASTECDSADEKGRLYFDSTANAFKYCDGSAWSDLGGGGGGGGYDSISYSQFPNNADTASIYEDSNIRIGWNDDAGGNHLTLELLTDSGGAGGVTAICRIVPGTYVVSGRYEITALNTPSDIAQDIANKGSVNCMIAARDDATYPFYEVGIVNTDLAANKNSIKVEKLVP